MSLLNAIYNYLKDKPEELMSHTIAKSLFKGEYPRSNYSATIHTMWKRGMLRRTEEFGKYTLHPDYQPYTCPVCGTEHLTSYNRPCSYVKNVNMVPDSICSSLCCEKYLKKGLR